jgi:hypothetical protein
MIGLEIASIEYFFEIFIRSIWIKDLVFYLNYVNSSLTKVKAQFRIQKLRNVFIYLKGIITQGLTLQSKQCRFSNFCWPHIFKMLKVHVKI